MSSAAARSVLLVGDPQNARALRDVLGQLDYRVDLAPSVDVARARHEAAPVDLALVHAELLGPTADALAAWTSSATTFPGLLVFADEAAQLRPGIAAGLRDFLLPPFDAELVRLRVDLALEHVRTQAEKADDAKREELLKLERDLQIGRSIQQGFLPSKLPQPSGWEITACFHPAREVAGDFYDAFYMVNRRRVGFVIADVCDKGVGAALFMSLFRTLVRSNAQQNISLGWMDTGGGSLTEDRDWLRGDASQRRQALPSIGTGALMNAVAGTNAYITENHMEQGYFATMFFGVLDPVSGALVYINGGHNPPVLQRADGSQTLLKPTGPAVGMLPGVTFKMGHTRLEPGDVLFAYTDGVTDARSPDGTFFSESRLFEVVGERARSAGALVGEVEALLKNHIADAPQFDDITMMALRRQPAGEAAEHADHANDVAPQRPV